MKDNILGFHEDCRYYLTHYPSEFKWLYWQKLPINLVGKDINVRISIIDLEWKDKPKIISDTLTSEFGVSKPFRQFKQICNVYLKISFESSIVVPVELRTEITFQINYFEPLRNSFQVYVINKLYDAFVSFQNVIIQQQKNWNLVTINSMEFNAKIAFSFFCSVTRKQRSTQPNNSDIKDGSYYYQIVHAHGELAIAISHVLGYTPFISNLTGRKIVNDGNELFMPNIHPMDYQFYLWCSICVERFYTFWETLIVLLYNYESLNIQTRQLSFGNYCKRLHSQRASLFNKQSKNLKWLIDFFVTYYPEITRYRHRIVHHEFTSENDGLLSAKFYINAYKNIGNKQALEKYNDEIKKLPELFVKHFNLCKDGFEKALLLIDELG